LRQIDCAHDINFLKFFRRPPIFQDNSSFSPEEVGMNASMQAVSPLSAIRTGKKPAVLVQPFNELVMALQTTLDIDALMAIFANFLQAAVSHQGYRYTNTEKHLESRQGESMPDLCQFHLHVDGTYLGNLEIWRDSPFSAAETAIVEAYACRLVYPLRNALAFRDALNSAYLDPLTKTGNRNALLGSLQREWEMAQRHNQPLSVIMLDIDHFKTINDTYGHGTGDAVLREVASCISDTVRSSDIVFRYGGEEFLILLANTSEAGAMLLAERIRAALEKRMHLPGDGVTLKVTASFGVASLTSEDTQDALVNRADLALYQAKGTGRNRVCSHAG
jgi:diguanylate cyclase (GGDEF)-like protein